MHLVFSQEHFSLKSFQRFLLSIFSKKLFFKYKNLRYKSLTKSFAANRMIGQLNEFVEKCWKKYYHFLEKPIYAERAVRKESSFQIVESDWIVWNIIN